MTRILVIDDHDVVRKGLITSLKANGFERIDSAVSTKDARSKIATFNPQAIIVDINLPDGSGFDLVTWVRKLSKKLRSWFYRSTQQISSQQLLKLQGLMHTFQKVRALMKLSLRFALPFLNHTPLHRASLLINPTTGS